MIHPTVEDLKNLYLDLEPLRHLHKEPIEHYQVINDLQYITHLSTTFQDTNKFTTYIKSQSCLSHQQKRMILHTPLKEMPIKINHENFIIKTLALWRLKIGK